MRIQVLAASLSGLLMLGASSARAHDDCDYDDGVTAVERGYGADVVHYDHHHSYYDEYGNPYVGHHDHHYVVPNDDYGYRRQYYRQYYNTGYGQQYYRTHRRHRPVFRFLFGG